MLKTVMIVNKELPVGLIANTTAVLGISLGNLFPDIVGHDIQDADGGGEETVAKEAKENGAAHQNAK